QVVTKRGTNALHGGVYEYYLDTNFAGANTWDNNRINRAQPSSHFNRFGAFAGGKIPHSNFLGGSWYMFGNYEGFRFPQSATFSRNFPTASLRAGLLKLNGEVVNLNPVATVDPATGTSYAANAATCVDIVNGCIRESLPAGTDIPSPSPGVKAPSGSDHRVLGVHPNHTKPLNLIHPI